MRIRAILQAFFVIHLHQRAIRANQLFMKNILTNNKNTNHHNVKINDNPHNYKLFSKGGSSENHIAQQIPLAFTSAHWMSVSDCLHSLKTSEQFGLSEIEAKVRITTFGSNTLTNPNGDSLFKLILEQFEDKLVQILLVVAVLSAVLAGFEKDIHAFAEPFVILSILIINAFVGVWQSKSAESSLEALKKLQPETATVLRDGVWINDLPSEFIVPGDILYLKVGDKIPADGRIISLKTNTFSTDEGSLTGESATVSKSIDAVDISSTITGKFNMVFSGTMVTNGGCYVVVTNTGRTAEIGLINAGVQQASADHMKTPLAEKLDEFGSQLTKIIGGICVAVWLLSIPKFSNPIFKSKLQGGLYYAKIAVALGVAAIPEGLPAVITLCLSLGTGRMAKRNVIVRKLSSIETLGCTSVICTDKTGTLTTNKMTVKKIVSFGKDPSKVSETNSNIIKYEAESISSDDVEDTWPWEEIEEKNIGSNIEQSIKKQMKEKEKELDPVIIQIKPRNVEGISYDPIGAVEDMTTTISDNLSDDASAMLSPSLQKFATICSLCNEAELVYKEEKFDRIGEPTEAALKVLVEKLGVAGIPRTENLSEMTHQYNDIWRSKFNILSILEFNRDRKSMSILARPIINEIDSNYPIDNYLFVKGASEFVTSRCTRIILEDGSIEIITDSIREQLLACMQDMAKQPLRCLALAYKSGISLPEELNNVESSEQASSLPLLKDANNYINIEKDLILVGFCGIKDPARPEAADAILKCKEAGIRVMMITGDSKETAIAIAKDVNILPKNENEFEINNSAFTGQEFFSLKDEVQLELLKSGNKVFCRTEPKDKQKLITMLEKLGEIPAMTGDGVNDAPALKQAAIGIAMGITGTEVAKSAADMILADDNFSTIVSAVEEGRNIYSNMQTFICFLISCNIGEIATMLFSTMLGLPEPLTPLHLLWVNLVTDGPPATALGFNPADPDAMKKKPRPRNEQILSQWMLVRYCITGLYVGFATIGVFVWWYLDKSVSFHQLSRWGDCLSWVDFSHSANAPDWPERPCEIFTLDRIKPQTMSLSVLVTIEMLKALSAVSLDQSLLRVQPWKNPYLLLGVTIPFILHLLALYTPFLSKIFGLTGLSFVEWKMVFKFALPILLVEELLKYIGRNLHKFRDIAYQKLKEVQEPHSIVPPPMF
eukprot:gene9613-12945_t